eukprot:CAMPEP_0168551508 /NCGR_PEP_ID=MMETSP0413-20121227/6211_1 /TAXON_ID=136452 /ORGANISM="Filamoeba nolandi, Strain NC-AS-23-1" /LENGTH=691 /DNA_ID=CAMNT_0008582041 /DNA_START=405 /DNA_END=2480 /DNA_ORIENTATION=+
MCGIFAYLNYNHPQSREYILKTLIRGLRRLEYRGYDSAGLSIDSADGSKPDIYRAKGKVDVLEQLVSKAPAQDKTVDNHVAISHTRWATHGEPSDRNSHPHRSDAECQFVVVHNGIVTNYDTLKTMLEKKGFTFESETDTEVIVKLALHVYNQDKTASFKQVMQAVWALLEGASAIIVKSSHFPGECIAIKRGSPLILGIRTGKGVAQTLTSSSDGVNVAPNQVASFFSLLFKNEHGVSDDMSVEYLLASDGTGIIEHTKNVVYLEDNDMIHFHKDGTFTMYGGQTAEMKERQANVKTLDLELADITKGKYQHYMQKEIFEQSRTLKDVMRGRLDFEHCTVKLGGLASHLTHIKRSNRLVFIACGTSYHSCVAARPIVEELSRMPVTLELASDFMDRAPPIYRNDTCIFLSQSGETADTLRALEYCKKQAAVCVGITNTVGSAIARHTDCGIYLNCGPEIGVASTKAYTSQIVAVTLFALQLGEDSIETAERRKQIIQALHDLPALVGNSIDAFDAQMKAVAKGISDAKSLLVLGRGFQYATCLEAALKIKEISYIHCEGVMAGELKHGPLALVDSDMPIIFVATRDKHYEATKSSLHQVVARHGRPIIICTEGDSTIDEIFKDVKKQASGSSIEASSGEPYVKVCVPATIDCLQSIVNIIPLQLLSYHAAVLKGCNVDQPRNLAKSVVVQ